MVDHDRVDIRAVAHDGFEGETPLAHHVGIPILEVGEPGDHVVHLGDLGGLRAAHAEGEGQEEGQCGESFHRGPILVARPRLCYYSAPMAVKAILWDLDGVLIDSYEVW